jgi:hypothetical protein
MTNDDVFAAIARGEDPTATRARTPAPPTGNDAVFAAIAQGQDPTAPLHPFTQRVRQRLGDATFGQVDQIFRNAGISTFAWTHNAARESGGNPGAVGDQGSSFGLFQLHRGGLLDQYGLTPQQAQDPLTAAKVMAQEARKQGVHTIQDERQQALEFTRRVERPASDVVLQVMRELGQRVPTFPGEKQPLKPIDVPYAGAPLGNRGIAGAQAQQAAQAQPVQPRAKPVGKPPTMEDYSAVLGAGTVDPVNLAERKPKGPIENVARAAAGFVPGVGASLQHETDTGDAYSTLAMRKLVPRAPLIQNDAQRQRLTALDNLISGFDAQQGEPLRVLRGALEGIQTTGAPRYDPQTHKIVPFDMQASNRQIAARYAQTAQAYDWPHFSAYLKKSGFEQQFTPWDRQMLTAALAAKKLSVATEAARDQRIGADTFNYVLGAALGAGVASKALPYLAGLKGPIGSRIAALAEQGMAEQSTLGGRALQALNPLSKGAVTSGVAQEVMTQPKTPQEAAMAWAIGHGFHAAHGLATAPFGGGGAAALPHPDAVLQAIAEAQPGETLEQAMARVAPKSAPATPRPSLSDVEAQIQARRAARGQQVPPEAPSPAPTVAPRTRKGAKVMQAAPAADVFAQPMHPDRFTELAKGGAVPADGSRSDTDTLGAVAAGKKPAAVVAGLDKTWAYLNEHPEIRSKLDVEMIHNDFSGFAQQPGPGVLIVAAPKGTGVEGIIHAYSEYRNGTGPQKDIGFGRALGYSDRDIAAYLQKNNTAEALRAAGITTPPTPETAQVAEPTPVAPPAAEVLSGPPTFGKPLHEMTPAELDAAHAQMKAYEKGAGRRSLRGGRRQAVRVAAADGERDWSEG